MAFVDRRAEKRVQPPADAVLDFGLWPAPLATPLRLPVTALGPPPASRRAGHGLRLVDATTLGLGLRLAARPSVLAGLASAPAWYLYVKLLDYRFPSPLPPLCLFVHGSNARVAISEQDVRVGLRILHLGRGSTFDKSLDMLDVSRFGVSDLAAWIDAVGRQGQRSESAVNDGLDIEELLSEPALAVPHPPTEEGNDL
jgi:hypothetical protein